jgi:hypothetical protein
MVNVRSTKCPGPCIDTQGSKKYDGYCTHCFQHLFPSDPRTFQIRSKTKEIAVRDYINYHFDGFIHDKPILYGCDCVHRRRIDHRKLIGNTILAIETDENQHKLYDAKDEKARYNDLVMAFTCKWIFIRFNPDRYRLTNGSVKNPTMATRLRELHAEIDRQKSNENTKLLEEIYLYYDEE